MKTEHLKRCDILFYKGKGFTSWLIQANTKSPYNHVAVVVDPDMHLAIESNTGHQVGVRVLDLRKLNGKGIDVFRVKTDFSFVSDKVISFLVKHLGDHYDWAGVIWLGALKFFHLKEKANEFQKDKDYFCSELVYAAFKSAGLDIVPEIDEADVTSPADIATSSVIKKVQ